MKKTKEAYITKNHKGQTLRLYPQKVLFWEEESLLVIADMHLGKASHFRRNGIAVPGQLQHTTLLNFFRIYKETGPKEIYFLGDLFHSVHNQEWEEFTKLIRQINQTVKVSLIGGNHDILPKKKYIEAGIFWLDEPHVRGPFVFCHHPDIEGAESLGYVMAGHIHPGYLLKGKAKQGLRFPSFHFYEQMVLLPAFGDFTGAVALDKKKNHDVYICVKGEMIKRIP